MTGLRRWTTLPLRALVLAYRYGISPVLPNACRFQPSCSAYALEALQRHGPARGLWLTVRRLARCQPWGGHGYDPVPGPVPGPVSGPAHACSHDHTPHAATGRFPHDPPGAGATMTRP